LPQVSRNETEESSSKDDEAGGIEFLQSLGQANQPTARLSNSVTNPAFGQSALVMPERMSLQTKAQAAQASAENPERPLGIGDAAKAQLTSSARTNTGAAIAGLQPWSRDWVFTQGDLQNPEQVRGVFSRGDTAQTPEVKQLKAQAEAIAKALGITEAELPQLEQYLSQMQGSMEVVPREGAAPANAKGKVLSGGDFLGAMAVGQAAPGKAQAKSAASGNLGQQTGGNPGNGSSLGRADLKVIDGGRLGKKADAFDLPVVAGADVLRQSHNPALSSAGAPRAPEVTGHVVQGRMAQDRLSSESLLGISQSIAGLKGNENGGEVHVRLKPDNLGELHLRVMTEGNAVGLKIQASDAHAKRILEESLPHLKESLSAQNLSLGQVEVSVAQATGHASSADNSSSYSQSQGQPSFQDLAQQQQGGSQSNSRWERDSSASDARAERTAWAPSAPVPGPVGSRAAASQNSGGSRIDLHA